MEPAYHWELQEMEVEPGACESVLFPFLVDGFPAKDSQFSKGSPFSRVVRSHKWVGCATVSSLKVLFTSLLAGEFMNEICQPQTCWPFGVETCGLANP